jgi:transposase
VAGALRLEVEALTALVESLAAQVRDLQQRLDQNSSNSSRPPSSDPPWRPKPHRGKPGERKRGGQKGHPGQQRAWVPAADLTARYEYFPEVCEHCLVAVPVDTPLADEVWAHQVYELPEIRPEVSEYVRRSCDCPHCGKRTWALLPPGVPTSGTGPRLQAAVSLLTGKGQMSRRNVQHCLTSWCQLPLGLGTISKIERRMAAALTPALEEVTAAVHAASVVYCDETRWREGATKPWLWAASTLEACLFRILDHRDRESFQTLFGVDREDRALVSDRYSAYQSVPDVRHGYCWAHLDRDFLAVAESQDACAFLGRYALDEVDAVFTHWHAFRTGTLDRDGLQEALGPVQTRLRAWLNWGIAAGGQKLAGFFTQVEKHWESLWVFATTPGVEPTNNQSERLLRAGVRWRKTSYGTQSTAGRRFAERMLTVTGTLGLQGRSVYEFLVAAGEAALGAGSMPRLLPPRPDP